MRRDSRTVITGDQFNRKYEDKLGNPLQIGDIVAYPVKSGSSATETVIAKLVKIVDLDEPVYAGMEREPDGSITSFKSWDKAWTARVRPLRKNEKGEWTAQGKKFQQDTFTGEYGYVDVPEDKVKTSTVRNVHNLVKVTLPE